MQLWVGLRRWIPALFSLLLFSPLTAEAAKGAQGKETSSKRGRKDKRLRVHLETDLFGFAFANPEGEDIEGEPLPGEVVVGFGPGRPRITDSGTVFGTQLGLGVAYVFLRERAIAGARVAFVVSGTISEDEDAANTTVTNGFLIPYFQWMFLPGKTLRPYAEARLGFGGQSFTTNPPDGDSDTDHYISPLVGFGGGIHVFPIDALSIDIGANFDYLAPHGRDIGITDADNWEKVEDLVSIGVLVGLSGWF